MVRTVVRLIQGSKYVQLNQPLPPGALFLPAPQLENLPWWGKNILRGGQTYV